MSRDVLSIRWAVELYRRHINVAASRLDNQVSIVLRAVIQSCRVP